MSTAASYRHSAPTGPIGVFDSGFGGLTVLSCLHRNLPNTDFLYLGDNARAPYGTRSFEQIYRFTLQAVRSLFDRGCPLVILACNTASAKALRTIQQRDLPAMPDPSKRVLGVIRPTAEYVGSTSASGHIGVFATPGTIASRSYNMEIEHLHPGFQTIGHACPMWVPLVENGEADKPGADYFVRREISNLLHRDPEIDTVILGCTHYPLLINKIRQYIPDGIAILAQGDIVANSLVDYLARHPEMAERISRNGRTEYLTTDDAERFSQLASVFTNSHVNARHIKL